MNSHSLPSRHGIGQGDARVGNCQAINIFGAKTHNLHDVSVAIPKHHLVAITGVSGSGKSSLVSTLAAGAQQAVASLFPPFVQARMKTEKSGEVGRLTGLTFTAIVGQKRFAKNARSTVGTLTGIAPYLRLMFSRAAQPPAGFSPNYSPNDPRGMCEKCSGLGYVDDIDLDALIDSQRSIDDGAIRFPTFEPGTYRWKRLAYSGIADVHTSWRDLPEQTRNILLYGEQVKLRNPMPGYPKHAIFDGVIPRLRSSYLEKPEAKITAKEKAALQRVVRRIVCPECEGQRVNAAARASRLSGLNIAEASRLSIKGLTHFVSGVTDKSIEAPRQQILTRCKYVEEIGLGYLSLNRLTDTLSGGESQRLRIVELLGASITDATFVLDEPSSGLHPADVDRLLESLKRLRNVGNTVIVVEHNPQIIAASDHILELGPGAGIDGGSVIFEGPPHRLAVASTPTAKALRQRVKIAGRAFSTSHSISVVHASSNNLRDISVSFPLKALSAVSGVAGSGKSSLVAALADQHSGVAVIDQKPIAASSRSSLLTALNLAIPIRKMFAQASGMKPSMFSPNGQGACPLCKGRGSIRIDMAFMEDIEVECEQCGGRKFNETALSARVARGEKKLSIADVLSADLGQLQWVFSEQADIADVLNLLRNVGLGYLTLGQTLDSLSGGELQRIKLVRLLAQRQDSESIIVLDEVFDGLHPQDVNRLVAFLRNLSEQGRTIIVVEHNPLVIGQVDYVVDLGPGAGDEGGNVVFSGTPTALAECEESTTGKWLRRLSKRTKLAR
ncbi:ATP-binding cassette domain-containing protein [Corynebacterium lactis]|uniref:ATP-binding cassette domain-containing protein n=1 Tax=Corynebacterium lactis TaxID=1231000 RepID=UPI001B80B2C2|nr:ATP-binding cassette domain-containing protein [Corynebacterium lactis]